MLPAAVGSNPVRLTTKTTAAKKAMGNHIMKVRFLRKKEALSLVSAKLGLENAKQLAWSTRGLPSHN